MQKKLLVVALMGAMFAPAFAVPDGVGGKPETEVIAVDLTGAEIGRLPFQSFAGVVDVELSGVKYRILKWDEVAARIVVDKAEHYAQGGAAIAGAEALTLADTRGDTPGYPAGPHLDAPSAANTCPVEEAVIEPGKTIVLVSKGNERLPVQLRDEAHLEELERTHGKGSVEVVQQS